jgi:hypothetical protein
MNSNATSAWSSGYEWIASRSVHGAMLVVEAAGVAATSVSEVTQ